MQIVRSRSESVQPCVVDETPAPQPTSWAKLVGEYLESQTVARRRHTLSFNIHVRNLRQGVRETDQEFIIRLLQYDFDNNIGMTLQEFISIYDNLIATQPERLI